MMQHIAELTPGVNKNQNVNCFQKQTLGCFYSFIWHIPNICSTNSEIVANLSGLKAITLHASSQFKEADQLLTVWKHNVWLASCCANTRRCYLPSSQSLSWGAGSTLSNTTRISSDIGLTLNQNRDAVKDSRSILVQYQANYISRQKMFVPIPKLLNLLVRFISNRERYDTPMLGQHPLAQGLPLLITTCPMRNIFPFGCSIMAGTVCFQNGLWHHISHKRHCQL